MKVLVFDFDGTLAQTSDKIFEVISEYIPDYSKLKYISQMRDFFINRSWKQIIRALYFEYKLKPHNKEISKKIAQKIFEVNLDYELINVLTALKTKNYKLIILSSNFRENIQHILLQNNIDIFDDIYGEGHLLRKYKTLRKIVKEYPNNEVIYIGDEIRDIYTARKANIRGIGVTWGINTKKDFEEYGVEEILEKVEDLNNI